jgi:hypothetical protein
MKFKSLSILLVTLSFFVTKVNAGIIYESANLAIMTDIGVSVGSDQFVGSRFSIDSTYDVTAFGGHMKTFFGSVWGAIVALPNSSSSSLPNFDPNSIEQHALIYGLFDTSGSAVDARVSSDITLSAGDYALIFGGSGWFGATGSAALATWGYGIGRDNGQVATANASYLSANADGNGEFQGWRDSSDLYISAPRFVIEGNLVSVDEPATFSIFLLALMFIRARIRKPMAL